MKGGGWICREEIAARKAHKVCICCAKEDHIGKDFATMTWLCSLFRCGPPLCSRCTPCVPSWQQSPPCRSTLHPSWVCHPCQKRSPAQDRPCMQCCAIVWKAHRQAQMSHLNLTWHSWNCRLGSFRAMMSEFSLHMGQLRHGGVFSLH